MREDQFRRRGYIELRRLFGEKRAAIEQGSEDMEKKESESYCSDKFFNPVFGVE